MPPGLGEPRNCADAAVASRVVAARPALLEANVAILDPTDSCSRRMKLSIGRKASGARTPAGAKRN